jgi:UDP-N-acetyl-D-glucosamine dehydrogenase
VQDLKLKLSHGTPRVVVVGGGYVGLPFAVTAAQAHCDVVVYDHESMKVDAINAGRSYVGDVPDAVLTTLIEAKRLGATDDPAKAFLVAPVDVVVICVPTPLQSTGDPDISFVTSAIDAVASALHQEEPVLISLESTVYPGCTRELIAEVLRKAGRKPGEDTFVSFSPERVDPGNPTWHTYNTPKVVGGLTAECCAVALSFYERVVERVVPVSSTDAAEMVKLLENTFRWINIGLVNELAIQCHQLGVDVWEVIEAARTKPFGFMSFVPGPGVGGHCIACDPDYLGWRLRTMHHEARFIDLAGKVNRAMPAYVVQRLADELNLMGKPLMRQKVIVFGVAYKPDVPDTRESPALEVIRELARRGAVVHYTDPHVANLYHEDFRLESLSLQGYDEDVKLEYDRDYSDFDAAIIATAHTAFDYGSLLQTCPLVLDARGITHQQKLSAGPKCHLVRL